MSSVIIVRVAVLLLLAIAVQASSAIAVTLGMVVDDATNSVTVFDADTDTVLGTAFIPDGDAIGDCSINVDQTLGFVTNFDNKVFVIDLKTSPPSLAGGTNPIPISNVGEDTSISPDQKFLVVCDGSFIDPVSVIDIATKTEISTFDLGSDCNSVDVCSDSSVLVTSSINGNVRRLTIDSAGNLSDTGEVLFSNGPRNVSCAPGGTSGVVINESNIMSFTIPWLGAIDTRILSGFFGVSGQINPAGDRIFIRSTYGNGAVDVFDYDSNTGILGASPLFTIPISDTVPFFGIDPIALNPDGTKLYVSGYFDGVVNIYDASTGAEVASIIDPNIVNPTGICFSNSADESNNNPPDCSTAAPSISNLFPPNHKFVPINVLGVTDPDGDQVAITINSILQDEPVKKGGTGSGYTCPDGNGIGKDKAKVRAERAGNPKIPGDGRVYHIGFTADDEKGGTCTGEIAVCVPHNKGKGNKCVDQGALFDSTVCQ